MPSRYERLRVESILRAMVNESRKTHPYWPVEEVWKHIDAAMEIMRDTSVLNEGERYAVVRAAYDAWTGPNH